jgi:glycosyltransferase involved in cell wall biosynthesis
MPMVSVVVPTHNRPEMLAQALASVHAQTFTDYEVIIVSNGESDEMRARSRACASGHGAFFELPDGNVSAARNFASARARGE